MDSTYFALYDCHEPVENKDGRLWPTSGMLGYQIDKGALVMVNLVKLTGSRVTSEINLWVCL